MEELSSAMNNLSVGNSPAVLDESISILINSLSSDGEQKEEIIKAMLDGDLLSTLKARLQQHDCSLELAAQLIAEMAKTDILRQKCSVDLIKVLIRIMSSGSDAEATQACRALGNICFDNDAARLEVCEEKGVDLLFDLLRKQLDVDFDSAAALRKVACGFLFNLTNTHECLIEKALSLDVLRLLSDYLKKFSHDENLLHMILLTIGSFGDSEAGRLKFIEYGFVKTIAGLLESGRLSVELQETILDLFANLAETDDIKLLLADPDIFNILLNLMKRSHSVEDKVTLENVTSDLIVLILTGDESMKLIYDNGSGNIISEAIKWMRSSSEHLQNSGALAIGNIARSDDHCVQLVQSGITNELLEMLERHPVDSGSSIIHHAAFSALRNLAIPAVNKPTMLQCQLLERVLPYVDTPMSTVLFKLLGTLRMIIDGQESAATALGSNQLLMQKLVSWCNVEDHQGVKGESNRLLASLVKNSRSSHVMKCIASKGAMKNLVAMTTAEHVLMQNEALVALNLIAASILESVTESLVELNFVSNLKSVLVGETGPVELLRNSLTLTKQLSTQALLNECMVKEGFPELVLNLRSHSDEQMQVIAKGISFG